MAKVEDTKTDTKAVVPAPKPSAKTWFNSPQLSAGWWIVLAVLGFLALIGVAAVGTTVANRFSSNDAATRQTFRGDFRGPDGGPMMHGDYDRLRSGQGMRWQDDSDSTSVTRIAGVVTAIDGQTVTVSGNGTAKQISIQDNTTYRGAEKPIKLNDSVFVTGTSDGTTLTATSVRIMRTNN